MYSASIYLYYSTIEKTEAYTSVFHGRPRTRTLGSYSLIELTPLPATLRLEGSPLLYPMELSTIALSLPHLFSIVSRLFATFIAFFHLERHIRVKNQSIC